MDSFSLGLEIHIFGIKTLKNKQKNKINIDNFNVNTGQDSQQPKASNGTMSLSKWACCEVEGSGEEKQMGKRRRGSTQLFIDILK